MAPYVEDDRPATLADIRSLRRWLAVAAIWAVAATALAVIALLEANKEDDNSAERTAVAGELGRVQSQLNSRLDDLESRIEDLPTSDDVSKLDGRLKAVEEDADKSRTAAERLSATVSDLDARVEDLETRVEELETADTGTETTP